MQELIVRPTPENGSGDHLNGRNDTPDIARNSDKTILDQTTPKPHLTKQSKTLFSIDAAQENNFDVVLLSKSLSHSGIVGIVLC